MTSSDENQVLQAYFDNFKTEIEESNDCVSLTAEALRALSEADAVTEKILEEDAGISGDEDKAPDLLLKKANDKKDIYYVKLSNKESIQVQFIESNHLSHTTSGKNVAATEQENRRKRKLPCTVEGNTEKEKIYEFDENDPEVKIKEVPHETPLVTGNTVMLLVPKTNVSSIDSHMIHQCPKCPYTAKKKFLLSRHLQTHSDERPYKCSVCDRAFKTSPALVNHMNAHLGRKPHGCTYCEMRFNTSGDLIRHVRYKHTGEKPHKCGECDYSSVELTKMRRHMRCHTGERPYQCPHCTYASPDTFKLKRHLRTHTGEKPYECDICLARFTQSNTLKAHRLIHTAVDRPVFQCDFCPTTCGRKTDLQMHMQKLHNPDRPVKCKRCGKELPDRYTYKVHIKTHEGEKCFRCPVCPYASIKQRHLDVHMRVHTDEKPFVCEQCGSCFRQRQLLIRHVNIHHNEDYVPPVPSEKSHVCPHCNKAFTRKGNLMRHMESHDTLLNKKEEKLKLRIGRQIRIQSDGSITVPTAEALNYVIPSEINDMNVGDDGNGNGDCDQDENEVDGDGDNDDDNDNDGVEEGDNGEESFSILEIEDEENVGNVSTTNEIVSFHQPSMKNNNGAITMLTHNTIKIEPKQKKLPNKFVVLPSQAAISRGLSRERVSTTKLKNTINEQATVTVGIDDGNEHIMLIEVIDENAGENEVVVKMERTENQKNIRDLPIASGGRSKTINTKRNEFILPIDGKPTAITIMDLMIDE